MPTLVRDYDTLLLYNNFGGCSNVCFDDNLGYFYLDDNINVNCLTVNCNTTFSCDLTVTNNALVCQDLTVNGSLCINGDLDLGTNKILYSNVYSQFTDLPCANDYHGMFAHVHGTGKGYFAHAGQWHCLLDATSSTTSELSEGTNLYHTDTRVRQSVCGTGDLAYNCSTGEFSVTTYKSCDFDTDFGTKLTCDLLPKYYATENDLPSASTYHGAFFHVHGTQKAYFAHGGSWHKIIDESSSTTNDLTEGSNNRYFTESRARLSLCGTGDITYCNITGEINVVTYKSSDFDSDFGNKFTCDLTECGDLYFTDARARASLCGGTGVTYCDTSGEIRIGQDVACTSDVTFNNVTVSGTLNSDDVTASNVYICGDLTVTGTTTSVNSSVVNLGDINILLACGATTPTQANGGGLTLGGANACIFYDSVTDTWNFNKNLCVTCLIGQISDVSNHFTCDIAECGNLYYTDTRARLSLCGSGDILYCNTTGEISVTTYKSCDFNTDFATKFTCDLIECCNLYYTDARARLSLCGSGDITYCDTTGEISVTTYKTSDFDTDFDNKFTCDLTECGDLYFTDARARLSLCGSGDISYCDTTGEISVTTYKTSNFTTDFTTKSIGDLCNVNLLGLADGCVLAYNSLSGNFVPTAPATGCGGGGTFVCDYFWTLCDTNYIVPEQFTATGTTTCFTLQTEYHQYSSLVYVNSIWQRPGCDYTLSNCILNFAVQPDNGDEIYVRAFSRFDIPDGTITLNKLAQGTFVVDCYTGNGNDCVFLLSQDPGDVTHMQVAVGGLMQRPGAGYNLTYSNNNPYITFTAPPDKAVDIEVYLNRLVTPIFGITNDNLNLTYTSNQYSGNGTDSCFTIASGHTEDSVLVFLNGILMPPTEYDVIGTTLCFSSPPLSSQEIDIRYMPV